MIASRSPERGDAQVGTGELLHAVSPRIAQVVMNTRVRMFPDSDAAKGDNIGKSGLSPEAIAMQQMMRGIHFRHSLTSRLSPRRRRRELDALAYRA